MTVRQRIAAAGLVLVALAGCTETPTVTRAPATPSAEAPSPAGTPEPGSSAALAAAKQAAGIPGCPSSDPDVADRPDGLPDVVLPCLGGGRDVRLAGLRGTPMLINVWAQWCGPCRQEAPFLADVASTNRSELVILGIDHADPRPDLAIDFAQFATWRYPQLADPEVVLRTELQIVGPPQSFFVTAAGEVAYRHVGPFSSAEEIRTLAHEHLGVDP